MREVEFVPLSVLFGGGVSPRASDGGAGDLPPDRDLQKKSSDADLRVDPDADAVRSRSVASSSEQRSALRDVRLFRARLIEAFESASSRLLRELATDVLARELRLAPCDVVRIVERIARSIPVVRVRVCAADVQAADGFETVPDDALAPGDAIVEVQCGAVDARLGVRLADVLEAFR